MKKLLVMLMIIILAANYSGCKSNTVEHTTDMVKRDVEEFKAIFAEYAKKQGIAVSSEDMDAFRDITPQDVFEETNCQVFKNGKTCESFLLSSGELHSLGIGFGGMGIVDIEACDFDADGKKELLYTYSWGSGLHRSCFGCFDPFGKSEVQIDVSAAEPLGFIQEELALKRVKDDHFEVYTAAAAIEDGDFSKISLKESSLLGEIKAVKKRPVLFITDRKD